MGEERRGGEGKGKEGKKEEAREEEGRKREGGSWSFAAGKRQNRDQLRNPTLGNRVWATFFIYRIATNYTP